HLWNFMGMVLAGLAFVLAGGCPGRNLVLSGEGNADSGIFIVGMLTGAAFAHNFRLASSPSGTGDWGPAAVIFGLIICVIIGLTMREKS
ncbi:MAG: YedE-related selenium metabolism membrane protein, partial [Thermoplasmata archaeon]